jgi:FlhB-like protein
MSEKTEQPTPRRLRKAAEDGDVPQSAALVSGCAFLVASLLAPGALSATWAWAGGALRATLSTAAAGSSAPGPAGQDAGRRAIEALYSVVELSVPLLLGGAAAAAVVGGVLAGGVFAPGKITPDLARLSPGSGLAGLASGQRVLSVLRAALTLALFALLARSRMAAHLPALGAAASSPAAAADAAIALAGAMLRDLAVLLLASGLIDLALSRAAFTKRLMMTHAEIKQESRESEGDPHLKAARERAHHELLSQASINAVREATVVIVNPTHLATALRYRDGEDEAPTVVACGEGALAARIVEAARHHGVPIVQDIPLARALRELEAGDQIPEALYETVAEVLRSLWESSDDPDDPGAPPAAPAYEAR